MFAGKREAGNTGVRHAPHGRCKGEMNMKMAKEELIQAIEQARRALNESIDLEEGYEVIYHNSVTLDKLIAQYIACGY